MLSQDDRQSIHVATALAKLGATIHLIVTLTRLSRRWARVIVADVEKPVIERERRRSTTADWLEQDENRRVDATVFIKAYNSTSVNLSRARRMISAYRTYELSSCKINLTVDQCHEILLLYENNGAWMETCSQCSSLHLVVRDTARCPVCDSMEGLYCQHCKQPMEPEDFREGKRGRKQRFCRRSDCRKDRARIRAEKKTARGTTHIA
jgi:hypothetical protein